MDVCTIIAKNYVAQARVLARSFAEHHPDGCFWVLVIDDIEGYLDPEAEPFEVLAPAQLSCPEFEEMALRYDVLELSTAVKPWLLAHLLREGAPAITYLDPDIRIFSSLESLDASAREHGVVLTPHNTEPLPDDGKRPNQIDILLAGVYNLGYVSLGAREETMRLLGWWRERLLNDCRVDPLNGYFVDQRWFDLAPGLVSDHLVVREPQYNVAYWNLHTRTLACEDERFTVDGEPLAFFHFSGFDPRALDVLSRHQSRIQVDRGSALERICSLYAEELMSCGFAEAEGWPYTFHKLPGGVDFTRTLRRLYSAGVEAGEIFGSPFTEEGYERLVAWLAQTAPGAPQGVNRVLAELYGTRVDLQQAFPDVSGGDLESFLRWACVEGVAQEPALKLLPQPPVPPASRMAGDRERATGNSQPQPSVEEPKKRAHWGVNVVGYFRSELGVGEAARQVMRALDAGGIPALPVHGRTIPPNRQGHSYAYLDYEEASYPVNLICMNADVLGEFAHRAGSAFFEDRYSIGMWFWEVERFPQIWQEAFTHLDELWLPTDHIVRAVSPLATIPITKITLPVEIRPVAPIMRSELGLPDGFMFLFSFDHHSVFERKNPLALIEAFTRAFDPGDGAALVVKSINAGSAPQEHDRLLAAAAGRPDIHVIDGYLSPEQKNQLTTSCDCYVSLHRAEGFGLTMAEAMYLGKPVIATGYSGNRDFMTEHNSFLVDYELVEIGPDAAPYPSDGQWAQPDVDHAARLMREVFEDRELSAERARRAAADIRRTHSAAAAAEKLSSRLDLIRERHGGRLIGALSAPRAAGLRQRVERGPVAGRRLDPLRGTVRKLVLRALKPFTAYQEAVNAETADAVLRIERELHETELAATDRHAMLLAAVRDEAPSHRMLEQIAALTRSVIALEGAVSAAQTQLGELPEVPAKLAELEQRVQHMGWESHAIPYMHGHPFTDLCHPRAGKVQGYRAETERSENGMYRSFEDIFRGSEKFIRERQRVFLDLIGNRAPVLDFGCGRGEFLDLLSERGIDYLGVDSDEGMVERCHRKGHRSVVHGDGLAYLESLKDGSLGALFCAQVVEHLPYRDLLRLLAVALRKLGEEGLFIAETVNPHSPPALKTFWVDPTHQHPLFPEVALSLCRASGFAEAFVFHPNGTGDVESDRFVQGEYAVVAGSHNVVRRYEHDLVGSTMRFTRPPS